MTTKSNATAWGAVLMISVALTGCGRHDVAGPSPSPSGDWVQTSGPTGGAVFAMAVSGTRVFAGTAGGVFRSTDNGATWTAVNSGLTNQIILSLAVGGVLAGIAGAVVAVPIVAVITRAVPELRRRDPSPGGP